MRVKRIRSTVPRIAWVDARQRIGNIAIANTDSASNAMTESAIVEAHRAVYELM